MKEEYPFCRPLSLLLTHANEFRRRLEVWAGSLQQSFPTLFPIRVGQAEGSERMSIRSFASYGSYQLFTMPEVLVSSPCYSQSRM